MSFVPGQRPWSQLNSNWQGIFDVVGALPNVFGSALQMGVPNVQKGDLAFVIGGVSGLYLCTDPTSNAAVWVLLSTGGGGGQDRFAPTHLVGNTAAGDSAVAYSTDGFNYYPDIGDCAQLAVALAAAAGNEGTVYLRRGTYSLDEPGSPGSPLVVPSNVWLQGEGSGRGATIIMNRSTGDQGALDLRSDSKLSDVYVVGDAGDPGSVDSVALVLGTDEVIIEDVNITINTAPGGALKQALRLVGTGPTAHARLSNVRVICATSTGSLDPTIGIGADGTVVTARGLQVQGGDQSIAMNNSIADLVEVRGTDWSTNGLFTVSGKVSIITATFASGVTAVGAEGIVLGGSDHTLIDVDVVNSALQQPTGIRLSAGSTSLNHRIEGCTVGGWADGIVLGRTASGESVANSTITDCDVSAGRHGVRVAEGAFGVVIAQNQIQITPSGPAVAAGIRIEGGASHANHIHDNTVLVEDAAVTAYGIQNAGRQSTIHDNTVSLRGIVGMGGGVSALYSEGERNTIRGNALDAELSACLIVADDTLYNIVDGNVCFTPRAPYAGPILVYGGDYGTVSGNVTVVTSGFPVASAGIQLTMASLNSNCIGNVCRGSGVVPIVDDLGTTNNVAQNVGAV